MNEGIPAVEDKIVEADKLLKKPSAEPTKKGYTFAGWYKDQGLTQAFNFSTEKISANITLHAKWTTNTYTVAFNLNGGLPDVKDKTVEAGKLLTQPQPNPTKQGYTFVGWHKDQGLTQAFNFSTEKISANITLHAKWVTNTYTVAFNLNGGLPDVKDKTVEAGKLLTQPQPNPTKQGYTFVGWHKDQGLTQAFNFSTEKISANITLHAKWVTLAYTVTFNYNNGGTTTDLQQQVEHGQKVSDPKPTRTGYIFANWYSNVALTAVFDLNSHTITQDTTLYAKWDTLAYTVSFNYNNGGTTTDLQQQVEHGQKVSDPKPTRTGYIFANWYSNVALTAVFDLNSHTITQDTTLYAKWDTLAYTVSFNYNNGGTTTDLQQQVEHGQKVSDPKPTRTGYIFANWYSNVALTAVFDLNSHTITQDTTLYAKWDTLAYTVSFNYNNGGTATDLQQQVNYGKKVSTPKPIRTGYTFANWYSNAALTAVFDPATHTITQDTTLYAKWDTLAYTITFNAGGDASSVDAQKVNYEQLASKPEDPIKARHALVAWFKEDRFTNEFDFDIEKVTEDITLYAKWKSSLVGIPGANFRAELKTSIPATAFVGDSLDSKNAAVTSLTSLNVSSSGIEDLTGIEYFTALTFLRCDINKLTTLDVSSNTQLVELRCHVNKLTDLNVSGSTALTKLWCYANKLTELDVSNNTALIELNCFNNQLANLDISNNTKLATLNCARNKLSNLDVSSNTVLTTLRCFSNQLARLDVSTNTALTELKCDDNSLADLGVSNNTKLTTLWCQENELTGLDVSNNTALTALLCFKNLLAVLDMRGVRDLGVRIHEATNETNIINTLKVHENLKDHEQIKKVKTARGDEVKIETYSADAGSTTYTLVCSDYDPTETDEQNRCKEEAP